MSERIDHVARAMKAQNTVLNTYEVDENTGALTVMLAAQVNATLALVEQQRIANLIALAYVADSGDADVSPAAQQAWDGLGVRGIGTLRHDIAAALGLGVPGE